LLTFRLLAADTPGMDVVAVRRAVPLFLIVALFAGACSSGSSAPDRPAGSTQADVPVEPLARVIAASNEALDATSMHMDFEFVIDAAGERIEGSGEADAAYDGEIRQHMTFRYDSFPGMPDGLELEIIVDGVMMYMRMPDAPASVSPTEWISADMSETVPGFEDLVALGAGKNDPSNAFGYLQGAEQAEEVGTEIVNGVQTTRFRVAVDLAEALDEVPRDLRSEMRLAIQQFEAQFGTTTMPFDAWVDDDGLLRRMLYRIEGETEGAGAFSMEMTIDISGYGDDFELEIPAAEDVTDVKELAAAR
jgi:hypothetical protein